MRVFLAGGSGAMGKRLVPQLVARGHQVTATTTNPEKLGALEQLGAEAVVMDGLDAVAVREAGVNDVRGVQRVWDEDVPVLHGVTQRPPQGRRAPARFGRPHVLVRIQDRPTRCSLRFARFMGGTAGSPHRRPSPTALGGPDSATPPGQASRPPARNCLA